MTSLVSGTDKVGQCTTRLARVIVVLIYFQFGPTPSKMKRHRHLTILERHGSPDVVSYIDRDSPEFLAQQRHVVDVSETIRYRGAVISANREGSQQRYETVDDDAELHNIRIDVDGIELLGHVHQIVGLFTEKVRATVFMGVKVTVVDGVRLAPVARFDCFLLLLSGGSTLV